MGNLIKKHNTTKVLQVCSIIIGVLFLISVVLNFVWYLPMYNNKDFILEVVGIGNSYTTSFMLLMACSGIFFIFLMVEQMVSVTLFTKKIANIIAIILTFVVALYFIVVVVGTTTDVQKPFQELEKAPSVLKVKGKEKVSDEARGAIGSGYAVQLILGDSFIVKEGYAEEFVKVAKQEIGKESEQEQPMFTLSDESKEVLKELKTVTNIGCMEPNYMCTIEGNYGKESKLGAVSGIPYYVLVDILIATQSNVLNK